MALTRSLAVEYGKKGLRANAVSPGSIKTAMTTRQALPENLDFKLIEDTLKEAEGAIGGMVQTLPTHDSFIRQRFRAL